MELTPDLIVVFLTLFVLELVLGVDNVVFISILASRLPANQQKKARIIGLALAMVARIILLFFASALTRLTTPLFSLGPWENLQISGRDLVLIIGGAFLIYKAVTEIHAKLEGHDGERDKPGKTVTFGGVLVQIVLIDIVFSLDSVITAVGMTDNLPVMIAAVVLSIGLMMIFSGPISGFVDRHPTVKMLALAFLVLIGATLIAEGFDIKVDKALIYVPIAFAIGVEVLNLIYRGRQEKRKKVDPEPVQLHTPYSADTGSGSNTPPGGTDSATAPDEQPDQQQK